MTLEEIKNHRAWTGANDFLDAAFHLSKQVEKSAVVHTLGVAHESLQKGNLDVCRWQIADLKFALHSLEETTYYLYHRRKEIFRDLWELEQALVEEVERAGKE